MKKTVQLGGILLYLGLALAGPLQAADKLHILTGKPEGTYYRFGNDIKQVLEPVFQVTVFPSQGSLSSSMIMCSAHDRELGIMQADVFHSKETSQLGCVGNRLEMILPLYNEEIHLLARKSIKSIQDLNGKRVSVGVKSTGTHLSSLRLLEELGVKPRFEHMWEIDALKALQAGKLDAMFYVIGYPAPLFQNDIPADEPLHLVPIEVSGSEVFVSSTIPAGTYAWQKQDVTTAAVPSLLVTRGYVKNDPRCGVITRFAGGLAQKLPQLREIGHAKWKNVRIDSQYLRNSRYVSKCALDGFAQAGY